MTAVVIWRGFSGFSRRLRTQPAGRGRDLARAGPTTGGQGGQLAHSGRRRPPDDGTRLPWLLSPVLQPVQPGGRTPDSAELQIPELLLGSLQRPL